MAKVNLVCCDKQHLDEYWHDCMDTECYAQECFTCGAFETLCGIS